MGWHAGTSQHGRIVPLCRAKKLGRSALVLYDPHNKRSAPRAFIYLFIVPVFFVCVRVGPIAPTGGGEALLADGGAGGPALAEESAGPAEDDCEFRWRSSLAKTVFFVGWKQLRTSCSRIDDLGCLI